MAVSQLHLCHAQAVLTLAVSAKVPIAVPTSAQHVLWLLVYVPGHSLLAYADDGHTQGAVLGIAVASVRSGRGLRQCICSLSCIRRHTSGQRCGKCNHRGTPNSLCHARAEGEQCCMYAVTAWLRACHAVATYMSQCKWVTDQDCEQAAMLQFRSHGASQVSDVSCSVSTARMCKASYPSCQTQKSLPLMRCAT